MANAKNQCYSCRKQTRTFLCEGCSQNFCFDDLTKHLEDLHVELEKIENDHDEFRQTLNDEKANIRQCSSIRQIDEWEKDSINKIKQQAKACREEVIQFKNKHLSQFENRLNNLVKKMKDLRPKNQFNELDLNLLRGRFKRITEDFQKPKNIFIEQDFSTFVGRISVILPAIEGQFT